MSELRLHPIHDADVCACGERGSFLVDLHRYVTQIRCQSCGRKTSTYKMQNTGSIARDIRPARESVFSEWKKIREKRG